MLARRMGLLRAANELGAAYDANQPMSRTSGWAHYEDATPGQISWLRHETAERFYGSVLIAADDTIVCREVEPGQVLIRHPSPRDLVAHLLECFEWPVCSYDTKGTGVAMYEPQDYVWDDGHWRDIAGVGSVRVGEDTEVALTAFVLPGTLGYTTIAKGCRIGEHTLVLAHAVVCGWCRIGAKVKIGVNATVLNGITVGDGATIGAGAVVTHDVPAGETWVGNPARRIGADADALYGEVRK